MSPLPRDTLEKKKNITLVFKHVNQTNECIWDRPGV